MSCLTARVRELCNARYVRDTVRFVAAVGEARVSAGGQGRDAWTDMFNAGEPAAI